MVGVLLMTYGAAETPEQVQEYMQHVYRGKAPQDLIEEFQRRYRVVGGSPLIKITRQQANALEDYLNASDPVPGTRFIAEIGMQHTPPTIKEGLDKLVERGAKRVIAIVMSPQYSPIIMGGYHRALDEARETVPSDIEISVAGTWHNLPEFIEALAKRVEEAIGKFDPTERYDLPIIFTAHSMPKSVVDREPYYIEQLKKTAEAVATRLQLSGDRWYWAYQSAGHSPAEWLKPDVKDILPDLRAAGHNDVLVVPVQFLADHLETLYDIDVDAREEAEEAGMTFNRIEMFNTMPEFIEVLGKVVTRELSSQPSMASYRQ